MHHPITGEAAYALSEAMVEAMAEIAATECHAAFVANLGTARALVGRGFVEPAVRGMIAGEPGVLYRLTERGATALRIATRQKQSSR
jgi:hypothetical protein